jgi:hypothetical protein
VGVTALHLLSLSLSGNEVHHQDPLHLGCGLAPWWRVQLNRSSNLLAGALASPWRCSSPGGGLPSMGLRSLPFMTIVMSLRREAGFRSWYHRPRGNYHHGLSGRSVLHPLHEDAMRNSSAESSIMACRGVDAPLWVEPMKAVPLLPLLRRMV